MSTKQRTKIQKKVREHHRKARRDAKKNPTWKSKHKEDPGIPNSFPYKEQLLDKIEQSRQREEQRRLDLKEKRLAEKRDKVVTSDEDDEVQEAEVNKELSELEKMHPDPPSAQVFDGSLEDLLSDASVKNVVFALDARDPLTWRCHPVEMLAQAKKKLVVLALTRSDLVPLEALASHLHAIQAASSCAKSVNDAVAIPVSIHSKNSIDRLAATLKGNGGGVAILGLENSGRSALAISLAARLDDFVLDTSHLIPLRKTIGADQAAEDEVDSDKEGKDYEDDFVTFSRRRAEGLRALLRNKGQVYRIKDALPLVWALIGLLFRNEDLMLLYNVPAFGSYQPQLPSSADIEASGFSEEDVAKISRAELDVKTQKDAEEFLIGIARQQGRARKGGIPDIEAAARVLLRDWCAGCVAYYSYSPGWTGGSLTKGQREEIVANVERLLQTQGADAVTKSRIKWKRDFVESQKARSDLHSSPAIGELRLKSAGPGVLALNGSATDDVTFELWKPREVSRTLEDDDDEAKLATLEFNEKYDEELDSEALVPDLNEDDGDEDNAEKDETEAEQTIPAVSRKDERRAAKHGKAKAQFTAVDSQAEGDEDLAEEKNDDDESTALVALSSSLKGKAKAMATAGPKKRIRMAEPTKTKKWRR